MSYKKKNILLLTGTIILFWVSWNIAIVETLNLKEKVSEVERKLKEIENAPEEIHRLRSDIEKIRDKSDKLYSSIIEMRKDLLFKTSYLAEKYNLTLKSFPDYYIQSVEEIELTTSPVVLSGDFKRMIQLIYDFEQNKGVGKISSASFQIKESPRTKHRTLYLTLYVQSINL